jgi:4-amino-4-deoxy-L-arabinose transferase-like glycosyltransferase
MMTKGLGAIVLPVVTLAVFAWLRPQARSLRRFVPWTGVVALVLVAAPWHVRMAAKAPPAAVKYYFFGQATRWLTGADREEFFEETPAPGGEADPAAQQAAPPPPGAAEAEVEEEAESIAARFLSWFLGLFGYLGTLLMKFFPWVMFLPVAVWLWRRLRPTEAGPALDFLAAWFLGGFVTFSLSGTQADRYIVPLYPAAAMLVGVAWTRWTEARRGMLIATAAVLATVAGVAVIVLAAGPSGEAGARFVSNLFDLNRHDTYAAHFYFDLLGESRVGATIVIALMAALAGACVVLLRRRKVQLAFAMLTLVFVAPMFAFVQFVLPRLDDLYTPAPLARNVRRLVDDDRTVYGCGKFQPFWRYYIERPAAAIPVGGPGGVKEVLDTDEPRYVLFWQSEMETIEKYLPEEAVWLKRHAIPLVDDRVDYHEIVLLTNAPGRNLAVARLRRILFEKLTAIREAILEQDAEAIAANKRAKTLANEAAETPTPQPAIESMIEMLDPETVPSKAAPLPP